MNDSGRARQMMTTSRYGSRNVLGFDNTLMRSKLKNMTKQDFSSSSFSKLMDPKQAKLKLNSVSQTLADLHGPSILYKGNPVIQNQIISVRRKAERYKLMEFKHKIEISGQGTYEITVKNLVNLITMKSLINMPHGTRRQQID